ncbi:hypothetical protein PFICI_11689 [Pestalotiopsis fici W106-1]|uniref:Fork-head domain-containing protein n=1 Tax=Pestalotiopsis fici (strain W106-1 / CGMCC3.15140) TaxID=1229662 RepID=W3WT44_PESFW|nr:uncharacterized protein PFICI_11689 [Pestalotiopsis fici W106-1]ETS76302.1 hypothetical protein PFICI_11689 [Pestalotiopsis fici W106-1]
MAHPTRGALDAQSLHQLQDLHRDDFYVEPFVQPQIPNCISRAPMPSIGAPLSPSETFQNAYGNMYAAIPQYPQPQGFNKQTSPFKANGRATKSPVTPLKEHVNKMNRAISLQPPTAGMQQTDSMQKKQPKMSKFKTVYQKPVTDVGSNYEKETTQPALQPAPPHSFNMNGEDNFQKPQSKRALLEAAPIKESRPSSSSQSNASQDDQEVVLPPHDSFPPIIDDGRKPAHSYAVLIAMAILRSPERRLMLNQIYQWIMDTYSFYNMENLNDKHGWQNSIRHNLSLNKAFVKQGKPKEGTGSSKGHWWTIVKGEEAQFIKEKPGRRTQNGAQNLSIINMSSRPEPAPVEQQPFFQDGLSAFPAPTLPAQPMVYPQPSFPAPALPVTSAPELSSDATIPLSDNLTPDEQVAKIDADGSAENAYSPFPAEMHSSPPIPRHVDRSNTPPPVSRAPASSGARTHKRKFASMDDSGYISSLESSAMRPNQRLSSEADRPRIKRGRAEEEIARLRASSYDSPTKARSYGIMQPSSSPFRHTSDAHQMPPPLTPALKKRAPLMRPPPSVSPNTNLRLHRDRVKGMLESPLRRAASNFSEEIIMPYSPHFSLDHTMFSNDLIGASNDFDIWQDKTGDTFFDAANNGSPIKRSVKRLRPERTHSANALVDVTSSAANRSITSAAHLKVPETFAIPYETPSKVLEGMFSPSKYLQQSPGVDQATAFASLPLASPSKDGGFTDFNDYFTRFDFENDENPGLDLLSGKFTKIGSIKPMNGTAGASKPTLGRSFTTTF